MLGSLVRVGAVTSAVLGLTAPDVLALASVFVLTAAFVATLAVVIMESTR